mgnify:CR=1 FL=1
MSGEGGHDDGARPKRRKTRLRALSEDEHKLWRAVVRDARPLSRKRRRPEPAAESLSVSAPAPAAQAAESPAPAQIVPAPKRKPASHSASKTIVAPHPAAPAPPLTGLDRRTSQRLARGQMEAEARLDLHGLRLDAAEEALFGFLSRARQSGMRLVLVITGKGESPFTRHTLHGVHYHEAPERTGKLRSALPVWLGESRFRGQVAGFQPAHPRHGGGGAFYIWLRKKR